jgi:HEXXH motif-containing protein
MMTTCSLSQEDLSALVTGRGLSAVVRRLRAAELGKHRILLAGLMREAARTCPSEYVSTLMPAYRLLADVENRNDRVARILLASPQFGAWASDSVRRLMTEGTGSQASTRPLSFDLGQLAAFASTAALRVKLPFEIDVPLHHGGVTFPNFGTAYTSAAREWEWGHVCFDARGTHIYSSGSTVCIPSTSAASTIMNGVWSPIRKLTASSAGLRFDVTLDDRDPFLDRYGAVRVGVSEAELFAWGQLLGRAWSILTGEHRPVAAMIASVMRTLVPLAEPPPTRSASSTAASAFGAIALSLPDDPVVFAEALAHEFYHAILSAANDLMPMTGANAGFLTYAPWRDDARPVGALLQGAYAHYGVARFWRRQRHCGEGDTEQFRGNMEFARWRAVVAEAADDLATSGALTEQGDGLVAALRDELATWQRDEVPRAASEFVDDLSVDHRVRWRIRHLSPDPAAIDNLAAAWRRGDPPPIALAAIDADLRRMSLPSDADNARSYLLMLRYRDPERFRRFVSYVNGLVPETPRCLWVDSADALYASGEYAAAGNLYLRRIEAGADPDAWAGLAIARAHTGPASVARVLAERPEVAAALYDQLRDGRRPDPDQLADWLSYAKGTVASSPVAS